MNEIETNRWFTSFASEQLFGLLVASSCLALLAITIVTICRRQSASSRFIIWHWIGQLACCLAWFNPLFWMSVSRALTQRERACDDQVINSGIAATDYGSNLVEIAAATCGKKIELAGCVSIAGPPLEKRIGWILSKTEKRGLSTFGFASTVAVTFVALSVGVSIVRPFAAASYAEAPQQVALNVVPEDTESENAVRLYGKVQGKDGVAISNATVRVELRPASPEEESKISGSNLIYSWEAKTDTDGDFTIQLNEFVDSRSRFVVVSVAAQGYAAILGCPTLSKETIATKNTFSDIRLLPSRNVTGRLVGPNGEPVTGVASMAAVGKERGSWHQQRAAVEIDGSFSFAIPVEYKSEIVFYSKEFAPKRVSVDEKQSKLGTIEMTKGTVVKGNVLRGDGSPVANVAVGLKSADGGNLERFGLHMRLATLTDDDGKFEMPPALGEFELFVAKAIVTASNEPWTKPQGDSPPLIAGKKLILDGEAIQQVSLRESKTAKVSGKVLWKDGRTADNVEVTVDGDNIGRLETKTDKYGRYSVEVPVPLTNATVFAIGKKDSEGVFHIANGIYAGRRTWGQTIPIEEIANDIADVNFEIRAMRVAEMESVTRKKFRELENEHRAAWEAYSKAVANLKDGAKLHKIKRELQLDNFLARKYLKFEEEHRGEKDVFSAIKAILDGGHNNHDPSAPIALAENAMMDRLFDHYLGHEELYRIFAPLYLKQAVAKKGRLYEKAFQRSPHRNVQAAALEGRIEHASLMLRRKQTLSQHPNLVLNLLPIISNPQPVTPKFLDQQRRKLKEFENLDTKKLRQDANRWIDLLINKYGDVEAPYKPRSFKYEQVGGLLRTRINEIVQGKSVPDIIAKDTDGNDFRLSSLKGKTVVLTFAFCTTQAGAGLNRAQIKEKYGEQGVEIVSVVSYLDSQKDDFFKEVELEKPYATFVPDDMYDGPIRNCLLYTSDAADE